MVFIAGYAFCRLSLTRSATSPRPSRAPTTLLAAPPRRGSPAGCRTAAWQRAQGREAWEAGAGTARKLCSGSPASAR
jgi:hypothetical protein